METIIKQTADGLFLNGFSATKCKVFINKHEITDINTFFKVAEENTRLIEQIKKQKAVIDKLNFIKNRKNQGASQENINKMAIEFVNSYLKEVSE